MESKLKSLKISCNKKSKSLLTKFLNIVTCKRQHQVEGNSSFIEKDDDFFTPTAPPIDFDIEQMFETDDVGTIVPTYVCEICIEEKPLDISFSIKGCSHFYCIECTVKYIESKLDDNVTRIACPVMNCEGTLDPDFCRDILPMGLFDKWGKALCESALLESEKFYCPYIDCSVLLVDDGNEGNRTNLKCPCCKKDFCVKCKVPWHEGLDCAKFQKLKQLDSDARLADLAMRKNWRQCPNSNCNYYVERIEGCNYIKCKCGKAFCYNCGAASNRFSHICSKCKR